MQLAGIVLFSIAAAVFYGIALEQVGAPDIAKTLAGKK
jgi:hypothetical protein